MKKIVLICLAALVAVACTKNESWKYGQGGVNACQFVKERVPELREDIESVEVIGEDSLLTDAYLSSGDMALYKAETAYYEGKLTRSQLDSIINDVSQELDDLESSWMFGNVVNDSLHKLEKYEYRWRKVYTVRVTMKSGVIKEPRVMMDNNGITPYCMEKDIIVSVQKHANVLREIMRNIIY